MIDHAALDPDIQALLRRTGVYIKQEFLHFSYDDVQFKAENDPFTHVDVTTEQILSEACAKLIPGAGFLKEESKAEASKNGYTWIIDPIDGTSNFTHGLPYFSISLALQYQGETVMGYVYAPMEDQLYRARKGQGADMNGQALRISPRPELSMALIATGFPYGKESWLGAYLELVHNMLEQSHGLRRFGSAALDLAQVAAGRLDAFFEFNLHAWDIAAGALLVTEAGGMISDFQGQDQYLTQGSVLASNGHIHAAMLNLIEASTFSY